MSIFHVHPRQGFVLQLSPTPGISRSDLSDVVLHQPQSLEQDRFRPVIRNTLIFGQMDLSLQRASVIFICRSTLLCVSLTSRDQAAVSDGKNLRSSSPDAPSREGACNNSLLKMFSDVLSVRA